ncbi:MAG: hypothetical protein IJY03_08930 [Prevotella sp.]|nr:hypothetical protein [Prevotella sp.]MBQ9094088.1 hypothetical protein [Prevotella sp.]
MLLRLPTLLLLLLPLHMKAQENTADTVAGREPARAFCGVIADQLTRVPQRDVCISMSNGKSVHTSWDGRYTISDTLFATASITKRGFLTRQLRRDEFTDTLFLLPASRTIAEVTVWGKRRDHANIFTPMSRIDSELAAIGGNLGFNALGLIALIVDKLKLIPDLEKKKKMKEAKKRFVIENY